MTEVANKITSKDVKQAIRSAYPPPAYQTFFEVSNNTGHRITTYADAVTVGVWPSTGHAIHGFEVKVSRGDFLNEMKNPGKSMPIFQHCHRWSLACPAGMVKPDELPPTWGLVELTGAGLRTKKTASLLNPEPISPGFLAALVRRAGELDGEAIGAAVKAAQAKWDELIEDTVSRRMREKTDFRDGAVKLIEAIKEEFGERIYGYEIERLLKAVKVANKLNLAESWSGPINLLGMMEDEANRMREVMINAGVEVPARKKAKAVLG